MPRDLDKQTWDTIIVGGGIAGLGAARALVLKGKKVLVLTKPVDGESSPRASGILDPFVDLDLRSSVLSLTVPALKKYARWVREIEEETGMAAGYEKRPLLYVAFSARDEKKLKQLMKISGVRRSMKVCWLDRSAVLKREAGINGRVRGGLYLPGAARVFPERLMRVLKVWLKRKGVVFKTISAEPKLLIQKSSAAGISLSGRSFRSKTVIGCLGAWAGNTQTAKNLAQPVQPVRGELFVYSRTKPLNVLLHTADGGYLIPWSKGQVLAGSTAQKGIYRARVSAGGKKRVHASASRILPELKPSQILKGWAGIRPRSRSGKPRIGKTGISGYYVANGYYRCGILIGVYTGELLARLILSGKTPAALRPFELK